MAIGTDHRNGAERVRQASLEEARPVEVTPSSSVVCPYCGQTQRASDQCESCRGLFDPLSRQATQNQMGSWFVRNEKNPFAPGMSYERIKQMAMRGRLRPDSIVRGPSTRQFWTRACEAPGVASLLGECHNCHTSVDSDEYLCRKCGVVLSWSSERQLLGLSPIKLLPGEAPPAEVASCGMGGREARPSVSTIKQPSGPASGEVSAWSRSESDAPAQVSSLVRPERRSSHRRRAKRRKDSSRAAVLATVVFCCVVVAGSLIAVFGFGFGVGEQPVVTPTAPNAGVTTPVPEARAAAGGVSERVELQDEWLPRDAETALQQWWPELEKAHALAESSDVESIREAIEFVDRVLASALETEGIPPTAIAALRKLAESLNAKVDAIRLRELIGAAPLE